MLILVNTKYSILITLFFICILNKVKSQTTYSQDFSKCNCDLTSSVCDTNCCCDTECSNDDYTAFKCSSTATTSTGRKWCVPDSALFLQNTPYIVNSFTELVCVDVNNSLSLNYYQAPLLDGISLKEDYVKQLVNYAYPKLAETYNPNSVALDQTASSFTANDYVWLLFSTNNLGYLSLPVNLGSKCVNGPPLKYFVEKKSNCYPSSADITKECGGTSTTSLSLAYFLNGFQFLQKPTSLKDCFNAQTNPPTPFTYYTTCSTGGSYLAPIKLRKCIFGDGTTSTSCDSNLNNLLKPTLTSGICKNLVKSVTYLLRYKNPGGVIEAAADIEFFDSSPPTSTPISQSFQVFYVPESVSIGSFVYNEKLSGNPGYQAGNSIQAGFYTGTVLTLNQDRNKRFTYLVPDSTGLCPSDDSLRQPIKFGKNVVTECIYKPVSLNPTLSTFCQTLQKEIDKIILGYIEESRANRFSPFANSNQTDWREILNTAPTLNPIASTDPLSPTCKSVRVGATIQIAYALLGTVNNPQVRLEYISYDWNEFTDINPRCVSQFCTNTVLNNVQVKISTRVTFVDVSQSPLYYESKVKRPTATLPGDFFYPLASSSNTIKPSIISIVLLVFTNL